LPGERDFVALVKAESTGVLLDGKKALPPSTFPPV